MGRKFPCSSGSAHQTSSGLYYISDNFRVLSRGWRLSINVAETFLHLAFVQLTMDSGGSMNLAYQWLAGYMARFSFQDRLARQKIRISLLHPCLLGWSPTENGLADVLFVQMDPVATGSESWRAHSLEASSNPPRRRTIKERHHTRNDQGYLRKWQI